eukprot:1264912-Amphidinium_carterae.3
MSKRQPKALPQPVVDPEAEYRQRVLQSLPQAAKRRAQTLLGGAWNASIVRPEELGPQGGVAYVPKQMVPDVLARVQHTLRPCAIITSQPATELHLPAYHSERIYVDLHVPSGAGLEVARVAKWITQLGFGAPVLPQEDGPIFNIQAYTRKMVAKFRSTQQYHLPELTPLLLSTMLLEHITQEAFHSILVRDNKSATFWVADTQTEALLRASGHNGM